MTGVRSLQGEKKLVLFISGLAALKSDIFIHGVLYSRVPRRVLLPQPALLDKKMICICIRSIFSVNIRTEE